MTVGTAVESQGTRWTSMPDVETPMKYFVPVCRYLRHGLIDKIRNFTSLLNNLDYYPTLDMTTHKCRREVVTHAQTIEGLLTEC